MIYLDSVSIQAGIMEEVHGHTKYSAETLCQWVIQSWTGVGSLTVELLMGAIHGGLLERYMFRLTLAYYLDGNIEKAWNDFVSVINATSEVKSDSDCPICYDKIVDGVQLKCQHIYHILHTYIRILV